MAKRILIVDDDEMVRIALMELLKPEGYEIESVGSAKEALTKIDENRYDLLMFDIIMPEMDGISLCRKVREREDCNEIPIVFLTTKSLRVDKLKAFKTGADDYIINL